MITSSMYYYRLKGETDVKIFSMEGSSLCHGVISLSIQPLNTVNDNKPFCGALSYLMLKVNLVHGKS